jgi:hypothetical protein
MLKPEQVPALSRPHFQYHRETRRDRLDSTFVIGLTDPFVPPGRWILDRRRFPTPVGFSVIGAPT